MKFLLKSLAFMFFPSFLLFIFLMLMLSGGGGSSASSQPVDPPASPDKATEYGMIGSEMGVPWEIVLLTDAFFAQQQGKKDIENVNPIYTSLEFLKVIETFEKLVTDKNGNKLWVTDFDKTKIYEGKQEILKYIGTPTDPANFSPSSLIATINQKNDDKNASLTDGRYKIEIKVNPNFKAVMKNLIGLNGENTDKILELYEAHYITQLYYGSSISGNYQLPEITVGDVSRMEFLQIAASIIGHPYLWGGKPEGKGLPARGLDCSGYVDWVYYQAFGNTLSNSNKYFLPNGINIAGTAYQFYACEIIEESELQIGDVGFYDEPKKITASGKINHVGIYVGKINGKNAFIHCGGKWFGDEARPTGRVGISINDRTTFSTGTWNDINNISGGTFSPAMKATRFKVFGRPRFVFSDPKTKKDKKDDD